MTIILSNEGSVADFIYLAMTFSPLFVSIDFVDSKKDKMGLRPLTGWQLIKRAIGVTLPQEHQNLYSSFKQIYDAGYTKKPIVVFPQCTKTNGRGVLNFPISLQIMLQTAI